MQRDPSPGRPAGPNRQPPQGPSLALVGAGLVALLASLLAFGLIAEDVHDQEAIAMDSVATPLLHALANPALDAFMGALTDLGSVTVLAPLTALGIVLLLWRRHRRPALFLLVSATGSVAINQALKLVFQRPRPELAWAHVQPEYSFPSGHAMNSLVVYAALALIAWVIWGRRVGRVALVLAVALALLIGTSRIYLGYHYLTDVVAGLLAGAGWLIVVGGAFRVQPLLRELRAEDGSGP